MTLTIDICTRIVASRARVWEVVEPIERHVEWMQDAAEITFRTDTHRGVGAAFDCLTRVGPLHTTDHFVITEWVPGETMGIEHQGLVRGTGAFTLAPDGGGGTRFCWREELTFPARLGGRVGEVAARPVLLRVWRGNLRRLKALVEQL